MCFYCPYLEFKKFKNKVEFVRVIQVNRWFANRRRKQFGQKSREGVVGKAGGGGMKQDTGLVTGSVSPVSDGRSPTPPMSDHHRHRPQPSPTPPANAQDFWAEAMQSKTFQRDLFFVVRKIASRKAAKVWYRW